MPQGRPGSWAPCTSPKTYTSLPDGAHSFEVRAIDKAGNADQTPASFAWSVDTTAPQVGIDSGPAGLTNDATPTFGFHPGEAGASVQCSIDQGSPAFGPCSDAGSHTPSSPLSDGPYTFRVRATDAVGNQATATRSFTVDTAGPQAPVLSATLPASPANHNSPKILGSAPAATTVRLYASAVCSGAAIATVSAAELEAGIEVTVPDDTSTAFSATATTAAENISGCSEPIAYVEDSSAPTTTLDTHPAALASSGEATFAFSGSDPGGSGLASYECRRDAGSWAPCTSPKTYTSLPDGAHSFEVRAIDKAGNADQTPASFAWSVDTTAPTTQIDTHPLAISSSADASFAFSADDGSGSGVASFQCRRDSAEVADWEPCSSPKAYKALAEGAHTFEVRAIDAAGNADATPASYSWGIDTKAPTTQIDSNPAALSASANAEFAFSGADAGGSGLASLQCRLDSTAPAPGATCTSPQDLHRPLRRRPHFRSARPRSGRQRRPDPRQLRLERRHHRAHHPDRLQPGGAQRLRQRRIHLLGRRCGRLGPGLAAVPPRLHGPRLLGDLHLPQDLHLPRRRRPQLRGPRDRQSRQRRPDPRQLRLERRHHRPAGRDRLRPRRPDQRRDADLRLPPRRGGGHRAVLDRPGQPDLRPLLRRRLPHALLAAQ